MDAREKETDGVVDSNIIAGIAVAVANDSKRVTKICVHPHIFTAICCSAIAIDLAISIGTIEDSLFARMYGRRVLALLKQKVSP